MLCYEGVVAGSTRDRPTVKNTGTTGAPSMSFRTRAIVAIGCVTLATLSIPALSRPNPRGLEVDARAQAAPHRKVEQVRRARPAAVKHRRVVQRPAVAVDDRYPHTERTPASSSAAAPLFGWPSLVTEARKYIGTNPTSRKRLWCARFMNFVLARLGYAGTNSDAARSFAQYGERIPEPKIGAIAVLTRGRSGVNGHVGIVSGLDSRGNPIIISGNSGGSNGRRVAESVYPRARVIAYVLPTNGSRTAHLAPRNPQPAQRVAQPQQRPLPPPPPHRMIQQGPVAPQLRPLPPGQRPAQASDKPAFAVAVEATMAKMFGDAALTR